MSDKPSKPMFLSTAFMFAFVAITLAILAGRLLAPEADVIAFALCALTSSGSFVFASWCAAMAAFIDMFKGGE